MNNNIYCVFPAGAQKIKFKNYLGTLFLLGRLYSFWNKKKKPIKIRRTFLLENLTFLSKYTLWLYLKELQTKNVITISKKDYDNDTMIIDFTDDFIKNYVDAEIDTETETEVEAEGIDEIDAEDIEECDNEDIEEQEEVDNKNVKYTPAQLQMIEENKKYGLVGDDYLPVEGWANTDRQDFRGLLKKYGGKVPEIPEEVLNFDFGQFSDDNFNQYIIDKDKKIYSKPNDMLDIVKEPLFTDENNNALSVNYFLGLRTKGELALITYLDIYECLTDEYNHLKNNGKI